MSREAGNALIAMLVVIGVIIGVAVGVLYFGWLLMLLVDMLYATFAWPSVTIGFWTACQFALVLLSLGVLGKASGSVTAKK